MSTGPRALADGGFDHKPVMLVEVMDALLVAGDGVWVDGTFGRGGHSAEILSRLGPNATLYAFDKDPEAGRYAREHFAADPRLVFRPFSFTQIEATLVDGVGEGEVRGVLLDLGVASPQLDDPARGFSFLRDGPLDMRMNPATGESAAQWLATAAEADIARVLKDFGEERFHRRIARAIVEARREAAIDRTARLAEIVAAAHPRWEPGKHPATRSFQAIRIHVNRELEELACVLESVVKILAPKGRLVVISFHSLEDRMVKRFFRARSRGPDLPRRLPIRETQKSASLRLIGRAKRPRPEEIRLNPRARSAVLRVAEREA